MSKGTQAASGHGWPGTWEPVALAVSAGAVASAAVLWSAAHLAVWLGGRGRFDPGVSDTVAALVRTPSHLSDPTAAWGPELQHALPDPGLYYLSLGLVVMVATLTLVSAVRFLRRTRYPLGVAPHAGLGGARDLRRLRVRAPQPGRLTLGSVDGRLVAAEPQASLAVIGPTGSGKTAGWAIPALLEWEAGPVIATSVKGDLIAPTIERRACLGRVWICDPTGAISDHGDRWTPLAGCSTWRGAMRTASWLCDAARPHRDTVTDGDYWYTQARKVLAPHLHAAALGDYTMRDVVRWVDAQEREAVQTALRRHGAVGAEIEAALESAAAEAERQRIEPRIRAEVVEGMRELLRARTGREGELAEVPVARWPLDMQEQLDERVVTELEACLRDFVERSLVGAGRAGGELDALVAVRSLWSHEDRLRDSIYATIQNVLLGYADPIVAASTEGCDLDFDEWLSGPNTIFVVAPADEQARLRPVLTVLVQQAVRRAYEAANAAGGSLSFPCLVLLDEAGNIAPLADLPTYAATARSHGISLVTIWQDLAQVRALYGRQAPTILNNHRARIFASGLADADTLEYVSRLVGEEPRRERNVTAEPWGGRRSVTEHTVYRRALSPDVIRRMRPDEGMLLYGSEVPVRLRLRPWYRDRRLRKLAKGRTG